MKITFFGAVEEVTGSRYLIEQEDTKILVDCGMFQGPHEITQRNTQPFPVDPASIHAIVLTHAHIDHSGYIPALIKNGFKGTIYCSEATFALASLLLVDSGNLQEEAASRFHQRGGPDHPPKVALYNKEDAQQALQFFKTVPYETITTLAGSLTFTLVHSGHILGSSFVILSDGKKKLTFSGDLGRPHNQILKTPAHVTQTDFLVIESTYGDRLHDEGDPMKALGDIINATIKKGGMLVIPCFAVGRTQTILYYLYQLKQKNLIPDVPVFLDSPMAISVTQLLCKMRDETVLSQETCEDLLKVATFTQTGEESKKLDQLTQPAIIIAGSGMADGGRVMFHLQQYISDAKNTVLFVGYQSPSTLGHYLLSGAKIVELYGQSYTVHARIQEIGMLSAHADADEILEWLSYFKTAPQQVFVTHGELSAAQALQKKIEEKFGWYVVVPKYKETFELD